MKFTTRFRPSDIGAAILLGLVAMLFTSVVQAGGCRGDYKHDTTWVPPTERVALKCTPKQIERGCVNGYEAPLPLSEISGYIIYLGDTIGSYPDRVVINDNSATSATLSLKENTKCYAVITTLDTDGRESKQSAFIPIITFDAVEPITPATIDDLTIVRSGTSNNHYAFDFTEVTTDSDGNPLTSASTKAFLFEVMDDGSFEYRQDIHYDKVPFIRNLTTGTHRFTTETEIKANGGNVVSVKSPVVTVIVTDYVRPVVPPIDPPVNPPKVIEVFAPKEGLIIKVTPE